MPSDKILTRQQLVEKVAELRAEDPNIRIGFTNGTFSILHPGHSHLFNCAREQCDFLIVAVNSKDSIMALGRDGAYMSDDTSRLKEIAQEKSTDAVIAFDEPDACELINVLKPDLLFKGDEDHVRDLNFPEASTIAANGGNTILIPPLNKAVLSSSFIRANLASYTGKS